MFIDRYYLCNFFRQNLLVIFSIVIRVKKDYWDVIHVYDPFFFVFVKMFDLEKSFLMDLILRCLIFSYILYYLDFDIF